MTQLPVGEADRRHDGLILAGEAALAHVPIEHLVEGGVPLLKRGHEPADDAAAEPIEVVKIQTERRGGGGELELLRTEGLDLQQQHLLAREVTQYPPHACDAGAVY